MISGSNRRAVFGPVLLIIQFIVIILFFIYVEYDPEAGTDSPQSLAICLKDNSACEDSVTKYHPMYQDVAVMVFFGIGFLMSYLKYHGFSSVGLNFLIGTFSVQWALLVEGWRDSTTGKIPLHLTKITTATYAAATVLISFGAVLGKVSPLQVIVMSSLEIPIYVYNADLVLKKLQVPDAGGSVFLHAFGAYFGLAVAFVLYDKDVKGNPKETSNYLNDLFSMAATILLWIYWPSFNAALLDGASRHRTLINNWLALLSSCIVTFAVSSILDKKGKFTMGHIQNATLAGAVSVGSVVNLLIQPVGAMVIGAVAGIVCCLGYHYLTPWLATRCRLHDTCGINNLHGMTGLMGGFASIILILIATESNYHNELYEIYPAMADHELREDNHKNDSVEADGFWLPLLLHMGFGSNQTFSSLLGHGRSRQKQAFFHLAGIFATLGTSILGGLFTGLVMKLPIFDPIPSERYFDDSRHWLLPSDTDDVEKIPTDCQGNADNVI